MDILKILKAAARGRASDVILKVGSYPRFRYEGSLVDLSDGSHINQNMMNGWIKLLLSEEQYETFRRGQDIDFAYCDNSNQRYRGNLFMQRNNPSLVIRVISQSIPSIEQLQLPSVVKNVTELKRGLVLITGATGSGKSTTLASVIQRINETKNSHIITVEDPIEFEFNDVQATVNQREVGSDIRSFQDALKSALRQNPDVIFVGELRDKETTEMALMAAETGHLVFSTLHTSNASETFTRILGYFPPHQHSNLRLMLANTLNMIVSQRLISMRDNKGLIAAHEIMINNATIQEIIKSGEDFSLIDDVIYKDSSGSGMRSFDQSLLKLYHKKIISSKEAIKQASNPSDLKLKLSGVS